MRALAFALMGLGCIASSTQVLASGPLPPIVAALVAEDGRACGGQPVHLKHGFLIQKDINGDGKPDYILNFQYFYCGTMQGFCGSGGCSSVVFASRNGTYVKVLDDLVQKVEFKRVGGRPAMLVLTRGDACGKGPQDVCKSLRVWNGQTFSPAG